MSESSRLIGKQLLVGITYQTHSGEFILRHVGQDRPGRDNSRHAMGQTASGRYLCVIYVPDEQGDGVFVVTAWEMRGNELRAYRRRRRR